ncbi:rCG28011, isoform CRA_a [Rattus norvegicus]|uniref:RCG28011, isoform CRA_a n=1 Tax=Rattus norvegicus TaxID=10116 RepID=A6IES6_RAT|nr:rCG28011, isoform CRA_a [Rattus norvegicus]
MARVSAQWRSLLVWWASSCPISLEGRAGSHDAESPQMFLHSRI